MPLRPTPSPDPATRRRHPVSLGIRGAQALLLLSIACHGDKDSGGPLDTGLPWPAEDADGDGAAADVDCDDHDSTAYPGGLEVCDGVDNDCDPSTSEEGRITLRGIEYATIQEAVIAARPDDTIEVCSGTWAGTIDLSGDLRLYAPAGAESTILIASDGQPGVRVREGRAIVEGFTITGGTGAALRDGSLGGGGISAFDALSLDVVDCLVAGNRADLGGGILGPELGVLTLEGSLVEGNTAEDAGGGVWASSVQMERSTLRDNTARLGGGLYLSGGESEGRFTELSGNTAESGGGASLAGGASLRFASFRDNSAEFEGGGVLLDEASSLEDVTLFGNMAAQGGGAFVRGGTLSRLKVQSNLAGEGGGLYCLGETLLDHVQALDNEADQGGGLLLTGAACSADLLALSGNRARSGGGALVVGSSLSVTQGAIWGNEAEEGGALTLLDSEFEASSSTLDQNSASSLGGGIYLGQGSSASLMESDVVENLAVSGGGAYVELGELSVSKGDWGVGALENLPHDVGTSAGSWDFGAGVSFRCTEEGCE